MVGRSVAGRKPILERWQQIGGAEVALTPRRAEEAATTRRALSLLSWKWKRSAAPQSAAELESSSEKDRESERQYL